MPLTNPGFAPGGGSHLPVHEAHRVWWTEGGDPAGVPVLMVHGGPGGRSREEMLSWWEGLSVRWIAIDQRGCGRSTPEGETRHNTLEDLLDDMERLRLHLGLEGWALAGGSWGAAVALAYVLRHPDRVSGLLLRSAFLGSAGEWRRYAAPWREWLAEAGIEALGPDSDALIRLFQPATSTRHAETGLTRNDPVDAPVPAPLQDEHRFAQAWARFDDAQSAPGGAATSPTPWQPSAPGDALPTGWHIFRHYATHGYFLRRPFLDALAPSDWAGPVNLVHGLRDAVCDPLTSRALAAWRTDAELIEVPEGGHRMGQPEMAAALLEAARRWVARLQPLQPATTR